MLNWFKKLRCYIGWHCWIAYPGCYIHHHDDEHKYKCRWCNEIDYDYPWYD